MTEMRLYPNVMFGRNRNEKEFWYGSVEADGGTVSAMTKLDLAETNSTPGIVFDSANNEIDLAANSIYLVTVQLSQTGAGASAEIYNVTGAAVIMTSATAAGQKFFQAVVKTTTAISIAIRVDDQTANTIGAALTLVAVERIGKVYA